MEDLLASIRKAINEDIGSDAQPVQAPAPQKAPAAAREPASRSVPEPPSGGNEIQQLREKITRSRTGEPAARDPMQRAATLAAALRSETPRRAWRDFEPPPQQPSQPPPRLRSSILDAEPQRPALKPEAPPPRPMPRYTAERQPTLSWPPEPAHVPAPPPPPAPREPERVEPAVEAAILSGGSAQAVQSAFSRLADTVLSRATGDRSIEDMTRELLRGMLKQWLDENLPELVERLVREEIERVARTGR